MSFAEAIRQRIAERKTDNERAVTHLYGRLDAERGLTMKKVEEKYNKNVAALNRLSCLYPNEPITEPLPFPFTLVEDEKNLINGERAHLQPMSATSFGLALDNTLHEFHYNIGEDVLYEINEQYYNGNYMGKDVVLARKGERTGETHNLIKLPPPPPDVHVEDYFNCLYRGPDDVVKSYFEIMQEDGHNRIRHFAGVPYLIREMRDGDFSNVSTENLHTGDKRRYIVKGNLTQFFMLEEELFNVLNTDPYEPSRIVRCSTGEIYTSYPGIYEVTTCNNYVVALCNDGENKTVVFIKAVRNEG